MNRSGAILGTGAVLAALALQAGCSPTSTTARDETRREQAGNPERVRQAEEAGKPSPAEAAARKDAAGSGDDAPYFTKLPLKEFMPHVMQYAADGIWQRQGYISDRKGLRSLFPKDLEEWEQAESGARTLAEITNVLLLPGRRVPDPAWDRAVLGIRKIALDAADAAERQDAKAWFAAGTALDEACDECHKRFDPKFKAQGEN